jgi:hypothetical protein
MPVSGLVVSLCQEPQARAEAIEAIGREPRITMGTQEGNRLAVVLDTDSSQQDQQIWQWLRSLPGVSLLEVAFVGFEEDRASADRTSRCVPPATTKTSTPGNKDHINDGC